MAKISVRISLIGRVFLTIVVLQAIFIVVYRCIAYSERESVTDQKEEAWILLGHLILMVFLLYFAFDAVLAENVVELFSFLVATLVILGRTIYESAERNSSNLYCVNNDSRCIGSMTITAIFVGVYLPLLWRVKAAFGWRFFKNVGGDLQLRALYTTYEVFGALLKLDFLFVLIFMTIPWVFLWDNAGALAGYILIAPFSLLWCVFGRISMKRESKPWAKAFFAIGILWPIFVIVTLAKMDREVGGIDCKDTPVHRCAVSAWLAAVLGGLSIIFRIMTVLWGVFCYRNFTKGLREKVHSPSISVEISSSGIPTSMNPMTLTVP